jgi:hypothetical protein
MDSVLWVLVIFAGVGVGLWLVSFVIEAVRPKPKPPRELRWAPNVPISSVEIGGISYIKTGKGPVLVLLHTLRTQLDLFECRPSALVGQNELICVREDSWLIRGRAAGALARLN